MADVISTCSESGDKGTPTPSGDFYTTLTAWESAAQLRFGTTPNHEICECYADYAAGYLLDSLYLDWPGTDANNHPTIRAAAGNYHNGVKGAGFVLQTDGSNSFTILNTMRDAVFEDIEISNLRGANLSGNPVASQGANTVVIFKRCIIHKARSTNTATGLNVITISSGGGVVLDDCHLFGGNSIIYEGTASPYIFVNNCTFTDYGRFGIECNSGSVTINNCVTYSVGAAGQGFTFGTISNCASGDGSSGTTVIDATAFVDYQPDGAGDYNPAPGGLLVGTGTNSVLPLNDITRYPQNDPPEIGAWAIQGAAPYTFVGPDIDAQTGTDGTPYTFQDGGNGDVSTRFSDPGTYALAAGSDALPAGMTINATTGNPEGTPTEAVTRNITITGTKA